MEGTSRTLPYTIRFVGLLGSHSLGINPKFMATAVALGRGFIPGYIATRRVYGPTYGVEHTVFSNYYKYFEINHAVEAFIVLPGGVDTMEDDAVRQNFMPSSQRKLFISSFSVDELLDKLEFAKAFPGPGNVTTNIMVFVDYEIGVGLMLKNGTAVTIRYIGTGRTVGPTAGSVVATVTGPPAGFSWFGWYPSTVGPVLRYREDGTPYRDRYCLVPGAGSVDLCVRQGLIPRLRVLHDGLFFLPNLRRRGMAAMEGQEVVVGADGVGGKGGVSRGGGGWRRSTDRRFWWGVGGDRELVEKVGVLHVASGKRAFLGALFSIFSGSL
ncbi:hypothetical protein DM860_014038 [Cuscuta australis]|uniref:Cytokinin riboside 5'-monophosphate phosphoribohydrolase n=1 Tax=Cuscuta australis TaxID=267555 RepID=A0A328DNF8_9ASTE|nr:hypothetical protein DM860_014038 [Cuscuta australis]